MFGRQIPDARDTHVDATLNRAEFTGGSNS